MKKLLVIVVLCLLFSKSANADNLPLKLFGIKIYDDAKLYVDLNNGNTSDLRPGIISYVNSEEKPFNNLIENSNLDQYRLRTNNDHKILIITGAKNIDDGTSPENFTNKCKTSQKDYKNILADYYQVKQKRFIREYHKAKTESGKIYLFSSDNLNYSKANNKLMLSITCSYFNSDNEIYSWFYISLQDKEYYENSTLKLWKKTEPFPDSLITSNLKGF